MPRNSVAPPDIHDDPLAKAVWHDVQTYMRTRDTPAFQHTDLKLLEEYVRALKLIRDSMAERGGRLTTVGSQGNMVPHPGIATEQKARADVLRFAKALQITPEDRRRNGAPSDPTQDDPLAGIIT